MRILLLLIVVFGIQSSPPPPDTCFSSLVISPPNSDGTELKPNAYREEIALQNCGLQYPECFTGNELPAALDFPWANENAVCREVFRYTIPPRPTSSPVEFPSSGDLTCPPTHSFDCGCQLRSNAGALKRKLNVQVSATQDSCCRKCVCAGDVSDITIKRHCILTEPKKPHCISFDGAEESWVVCDGRNPNTCFLEKSYCESAIYDGAPCLFTTDSCTPDPTVTAPAIMNFYSKQYIDDDDGENKFVKIDLVLGNLGYINCVNIQYGILTEPILATICTPLHGGLGISTSEMYSINNNTIVQVGAKVLSKFNSATKLQLKTLLRFKNNPAAQHLEVYLEDQSNNPGTSRGGFCQTGVIIENPVPKDTPICTPNDKFLYLRLCANNKLSSKCDISNPSPSAVLSAKIAWCNGAFSKDGLGKLNCYSQQWYISVCQRLAMTHHVSNAETIDRCILNMKIIPNDMVRLLPGTRQKGTPTIPPTTKNPTPSPTPCTAFAKHPFPSAPGDYIGNDIPNPDSYIWFQKLISSSSPETFSKPTLWFSVDQVLCGQNLTIDESLAAVGIDVMAYGETYRIVQCQHKSLDCGLKFQQSKIRIQSVDGNIADANPLYSQAFGSLLYHDVLSCNQARFPHCPLSYKCCIWPSEQLDQWKSCMNNVHPGYDVLFPYCKPIPKVAPCDSGCDRLQLYLGGTPF